MIRKEAVIALLGSPVAYYTAFARVLGGVEAGVLTSQFFYWYGRGQHPDGWIYKTQAEIEQETGLTRRNQETARKKLRELGVLEEIYAGMPAKLYYRLNLDKLFSLVNEWFSTTPEDAADGLPPGGLPPDFPLHPQDGGSRHPRMSEPAIQGSANPPSKDVQIRQPSMRVSARHGSANPPSMPGGKRQPITKTTTKTTSENTTETTTPTPAPTVRSTPPVAVDVAVDEVPPPDGVVDWVWTEFQDLLGPGRTLHAADADALAALSAYPAHIVRQALDAAHDWLARPQARPIHSLARWLVGTAQRKQEAELVRGNSVDAAPPGTTGYLWALPAVDSADTADTDPPAADPPDPPTAEQALWRTVLAELARQLPEATFESWLRDTELVAAGRDEYTVGLPNAQAKDWVENRLAHTLKRTLASLLGGPVTVRFQVLPSPAG